MKAQKHIRQQRDKRDRRVVWTQISASGLDLLSRMDPEIREIPRELLGHLKREQLDEFIRLLELARKNCMDPQGPVSCEGETCETG